MLLEIGSAAKGKQVLQETPWRNLRKPATALRCSGPSSNDRAGWHPQLLWVGDQPEPKSSGRGGFLLDIFTHNCFQPLVTLSMRKC